MRAAILFFSPLLSPLSGQFFTHFFFITARNTQNHKEMTQQVGETYFFVISLFEFEMLGKLLRRRCVKEAKLFRRKS